MMFLSVGLGLVLSLDGRRMKSFLSRSLDVPLPGRTAFFQFSERYFPRNSKLLCLLLETLQSCVNDFSETDAYYSRMKMTGCGTMESL